jgi:hypothetical protein
LKRLVVLGASNLTRGLATVVEASRESWGDPIEIIGALGHGRSYGIRSQLLVRSLPGILESGLWAQLESMPSVETRALVTDVGNDILYGVPVPTILGWVQECVARLEQRGSEVVLTDLPTFNVSKLSSAKFKFFRSVLVPSCRLSFATVVERAAAVNDGLADLASRGRRIFMRLRPQWYGIDPIHIRPHYWADAWREILFAGSTVSPSAERDTDALSAFQLYRARPARRWMWGVEQRRQQPVLRTAGGTTIWLY